LITRSRFRRRTSAARCREVKRVINAWIDGEVEEDFAEKIADHLEDCRRCGLAVDIYGRIKESLKSHPPEIDDEAIARLREFGRSLADG
jgi:anti-sigma factor RsiW